MNRGRTPYFKLGSGLNEDGFQSIEYGYCEVKDNKAVNIEVIKIDSPDTVILPFRVHIDATTDGYFCIISDEYKWDNWSTAAYLIKKV